MDRDKLTVPAECQAGVRSDFFSENVHQISAVFEARPNDQSSLAKKGQEAVIEGQLRRSTDQDEGFSLVSLILPSSKGAGNKRPRTELGNLRSKSRRRE
jgi:hypothetical protein